MVENYQLKENLWWVGIEDFEMRTFDVIMTTMYGSSFNSYILKGSEKTVLFETEKVKFFDEYKENIESVTSINDIDYIVMNHTEPDHADGIGELLKINPNIEIYGTMMAINNLKQIMNRDDFKCHIVKNKETLSLGDLTLEFNVLPNLHWPDTMWTYCPEIKALFPCDSFGSHFANKGIVRSKVENEEGYWDAAKYYFDCILGPFKPFVQKGLAAFDTMDVELICTGHGPVLDSHIDEIVEKYKEWSTIPTHEGKIVAIPYVSAYGYTKMLADAMVEGLKEVNVDAVLYNMEDEDLATVVEKIIESDGFLLGSPTILGEALPPIFDITSRLQAGAVMKKPAAAFGSFGWSGEAVPHLEARLKELRTNVQPGMRVKFKPNEEDLVNAKEFGKNFGEIVNG